MKKLIGFFTLFSVISLITISTGLEQRVYADKQNITVDIDYTVKIGKQKHLVHLTVCAGDDDVSNSSMIVYSIQDSKEVNLQKVLPSNTCQSYEVVIEAKHANKIGVLVI